MKLHLTFIVVIYMILPNGNLSIGTDITMQQTQDERQFKKGFKESYSGRKYNYEGEATARPASSKHGKGSRYAENRSYVKEESDSNNLSLNFSVFNWLFIGILIIAVAYLAYTLLNDGSSKLFSSRKNEYLNSHGTITSENIAQVDINALITNAEQTKDYRLAIRYYYLLVLKRLTLENFIKYEEDKTNADYMEAIASQKFSKDFAYTSYIYDYTWYGEFLLNKEQYQMAKNSFVQLIKKINA